MMKSISLLLQSSAVKKSCSLSVAQVRLLRCVLCSLLLSIASRLVVFLPFCPVPMVLQVQLCLFFAALYGAVDGFIIVALFLLQGIMGAPVFAGGAAGILHFLGPSGGYLIGYALGAFCTGKILETYKEQTILAMVIGNIIIYIMGALHLSNFIPMQQAWLLGVLPYVPLDLVKIAFFAKMQSFNGKNKREQEK